MPKDKNRLPCMSPQLKKKYFLYVNKYLLSYLMNNSFNLFEFLGVDIYKYNN